MAIEFKNGHIPEIVGLRGLALALVVFFHLLGDGRVSGGVDVFLFLSGFLVTLSLVRKVERQGSFSLLAHYGRTLRRLVPAALLVLIAVAIATISISPRTRWAQIGNELIASALYFENWELIRSQLAYGAAGPATSPLQHYWSLSVQGQFFLLWPLALLALLLGVRKLRVGFVATVGIIAGALTLGSFVWAQVLSAQDPAVNYLHSGARLWELTLGATLATIYPLLRLPANAKRTLAWLGICMIVASGFVFDGAQQFPAYPALLPVLGAALVVIGAGPNSRFSVQRALGTRPLNFLAEVSYPLYLWHWPVLIFFMEYRGAHSVGPKSALAVLGASVLLAWTTQVLVARPSMAKAAHLSAPRLAIPVIAPLVAFSLAASTSVYALRTWEDNQLAGLPEGVSPYYPGALVLTEDVETPPDGWPAKPVPGIAAAQRDVPTVYSAGCIQNHRDAPGMDEVLVCEDAQTVSPRKRIVLSGGSHAVQWYDALRAVADRQQWELLIVDKDGCRLGMDAESVPPTTSCGQWNESAREVIRDLAPDAVFTVGTRTPDGSGDVERVSESEVRVWEFFSDHGIPTLVIRDTPRFPERVPDCLARHGTDNASACSRAESDIYLDTNPLDQLVLPAKTVPLDLSHAFCRAGSCDVIIGNVVVYRDKDHMTSTYAKTLWHALEDELRREAPWLFDPPE